MTTERIAVVDVETTGLSPWRHDRVVEIAVVVLAPDGTVEAEYDTLVNPRRDLGSSHVHGITAADVAQAPSFEDVAGDVLAILAAADAIAGHNVSFDRNFLIKEYERLGADLPETPLLCTCRLFGRQKLSACCAELGLTFEGMPHRALSDARMTAYLVAHLCREDRSLLDGHRIAGVAWPTVPARGTPRHRREEAEQSRTGPPRFLQRLAGRLRHDVEAETPNVLAYLALIDRVLEDRTIDRAEEDTLVEAATAWGLTETQLAAAHAQYLSNLAVAALADGIVTESERRDLHTVARLLGQDDAALDGMLASALAQLSRATVTPMSASSDSLRGQRVCFTGELTSTIGGRPVEREMAEALAARAGLEPVGSVTKKLDLLVVADPDTQSGKARKARDYGIRILSDVVFWRMIGVTVD